MASLFAVASIDKFAGGMGTVAARFIDIFKDSWLPLPLVTLHAHLIAWAEALIAIWLLSGYRLKNAWIFTAFILISLAFGMTVVKQYQVASENYLYVFLACVGLYFSQHDKLVIKGK